jgi:CO/xanthine dehydrogenase Mo-binding subunit
MEEFSVIGKHLSRVDANEIVRGEAIYTLDIQLPGMLYGKVLRSPYSHARILNINTEKAKRLPGVKAVITADDTNKEKYGSVIKDEHFLAVDKVRYMGDEVAAVAAIDEEIAEEALDLVEVEYEELPVIFDPEEAMRPEAPQIHEKGDNIALHIRLSRGNIEKGFGEADEIFEDKFTTHSVHHCYLEPLACVAQFDGNGKLTVWTGHMSPSGLRLTLAKYLGMDEGKVRVIQQYTGGAFGGKLSCRPLYLICALLAKKSGKPVKLSYSREEEFLAGRPRAALIFRIKTGVKKDGRITSKDAQIILNTGAYANVGPTLISAICVRSDNLYRMENVKTDAKLVYTNKAPIGAYRGFGNPQVTFAFESQLDMIAEKLGLDPIEIRLKNAIRKGDIGVHGWRINSCGLSECLEKVREVSQWKVKRENKEKFRGIGVACMIHESDWRVSDDFGGSVAFVKILEDGKVQVATGETEYGQGTKTTHSIIAAETLGVPLEDITMNQVDTDLTPFSLGPWGARLVIGGGMAVKLAAEDAKKQLFEMAAGMLEANMHDIVMENKKMFVRGNSENALNISEVSKAAIYRRGGSGIIGKGVAEFKTGALKGMGIEEEGVAASIPLDPRAVLYGNAVTGASFSAEVVEVEIDNDTGETKILNVYEANDCGRAVNVMGLEGQMEGAFTQGMGFALTEEMLYRENGLFNPSFLDYAVPTSLDIPPFININFVESIEPDGPFGAKGGGEAPAIVTAAASIANAIYNAIGVRIKDLPITRERILDAIKKLKKAPD